MSLRALFLLTLIIYFANNATGNENRKYDYNKLFKTTHPYEQIVTPIDFGAIFQRNTDLKIVENFYKNKSTNGSNENKNASNYRNSDYDNNNYGKKSRVSHETKFVNYRIGDLGLLTNDNTETISKNILKGKHIKVYRIIKPKEQQLMLPSVTEYTGSPLLLESATTRSKDALNVHRDHRQYKASQQFPQYVPYHQNLNAPNLSHHSAVEQNSGHEQRIQYLEIQQNSEPHQSDDQHSYDQSLAQSYQPNVDSNLQHEYTDRQVLSNASHYVDSNIERYPTKSYLVREGLHRYYPADNRGQEPDLSPYNTYTATKPESEISSQQSTPLQIHLPEEIYLVPKDVSQYNPSDNSGQYPDELLYSPLDKSTPVYQSKPLLASRPVLQSPQSANHQIYPSSLPKGIYLHFPKKSLNLVPQHFYPQLIYAKSNDDIRSPTEEYDKPLIGQKLNLRHQQNLPPPQSLYYKPSIDEKREARESPPLLGPKSKITSYYDEENNEKVTEVFADLMLGGSGDSKESNLGLSLRTYNPQHYRSIERPHKELEKPPVRVVFNKHKYVDEESVEHELKSGPYETVKHYRPRFWPPKHQTGTQFRTGSRIPLSNHPYPRSTPIRPSLFRVKHLDLSTENEDYKQKQAVEGEDEDELCSYNIDFPILLPYLKPLSGSAYPPNLDENYRPVSGKWQNRNVYKDPNDPLKEFWSHFSSLSCDEKSRMINNICHNQECKNAFRRKYPKGPNDWQTVFDFYESGKYRTQASENYKQFIVRDKEN